MTHGADQQFLRMISDHHLGMIQMAHAAMHQPGASAEVRAKAQEIDRKQHAEARQMAAMLERDFGDRYEPKVMPDNQQMVERVRQAQGAAVDRTFYETVIAHHQEGVQMVGKQLPHLTNPEIRQMAEQMTSDQQREIGELQQKIAAV